MTGHSHHNTTNETGFTLSRLEGKARTQEDRVLEFFQQNPRADGWTPSQVNSQVMSNCPITSTRRAMTNLTKRGKLMMTDHKRNGPFGRPEHTWTLPEPKQQELI